MQALDPAQKEKRNRFPTKEKEEKARDKLNPSMTQTARSARSAPPHHHHHHRKKLCDRLNEKQFNITW